MTSNFFNFLSHLSPPSTNHMINVDLKLASDSKVFLTPLPLPLLATANFSKPAWAAIILESDQWMKRQERAEQRKQAQTMPETSFGP